jgi:hypothetical protein
MPAISSASPASSISRCSSRASLFERGVIGAADTAASAAAARFYAFGLAG